MHVTELSILTFCAIFAKIIVTRFNKRANIKSSACCCSIHLDTTMAKSRDPLTEILVAWINTLLKPKLIASINELADTSILRT